MKRPLKWFYVSVTFHELFFIFLGLTTCFSLSCVACPGTLSSFLASCDSLTVEESFVVDALLAVLESRMSSSDDMSALHVLMREMFPSSVRLRTSHSHRRGKQAAISDTLNDAIIAQLRASSLQPADSLVSKVRIHYSCQLS